MFRRARSQLLAALGVLALASGLLLNDVVGTFFFRSTLWMSPRGHAAVWAADLGLVLCGIVLVRRSGIQWAIQASGVVLVTVVLLLIVEGTFGALQALSGPVVEYDVGDFTVKGHRHDAQLGDASMPSTRTTHVRTVDGQTVYAAHYAIDALGRRVTPQANLPGRNEYLVFFGCSYTFGAGVEDDETLPVYAAEQAPRSRAYNYAFPGYGPHQMLVQLQREGLRSEIEESSGIAVYTFIDHHINRANGMSDALWGRLWDGPFFTVDDAGRLVHPGGFRWARPVQSFINYAVSRSHTAGYFKRKFPPTNEGHVDLTARIIEEARDTFESKFGSDRFYVVVYPRSVEGKRLIARLERAHVKVLDYSLLFAGRSVQEMVIANDGHPSPAAHRIVAQQLASDLGIAGPPDSGGAAE